MAIPDELITRRRRTVELLALIVLAAAFVAVSLITEFPKDAKRLGVVVAAGITLIMYSFLYRDNPLFKAAENLYVGVALGYGAILTWRLSLKPEVVDPLFIDPPFFHAFLLELGRRIVPIILGILLMTRLSRRYGWMSRYSYTLMVGWGAGIGIPIVAHTYILQQLEPAIEPLQTGGLWHIIGGLIILLGTVTVLFYFFFSIEHKGTGGAVSYVGVLFLMVSFGASFGYTVMGRVSLLIGRIEFLIRDWLQHAL